MGSTQTILCAIEDSVVDISVEGKTLVIKVDLTQNEGRSQSGKTTIIASTHGFTNVSTGKEVVMVSLNVCKK